MAGQEFKAKGKEVLQMKKDGAVQKNLADDTEKRVSQRDEDIDYRSEEAAGGTPPVAFHRISTPKQNLNDFTNKNIRKQRKHDILEEKHEAKLNKATFKSQQLKDNCITEKKAVSAERSEVIKSEYGSIGGYNKIQDAAKAEKCRDGLIETKKSLLKERNNLIKSEFGTHKNFKQAQEFSDCNERREKLVGAKKKLIKQRNDVITAEYGSKAKFNKAKKSGGFVQSDKLTAIDKKCAAVDVKIKTESAKISKLADTDKVSKLKASKSRKEFAESKNKLSEKSDRLKTVNKELKTDSGKIQIESGKLKAGKSRKEFVDGRNKLFEISDRLKTVDKELKTVSGKIKFESNKLNKFYASHGLDELKSSNSRENLKTLQRKMLQKSERLTALETKYADLGGKIKNESAKIKALSSEKGEIIAERNSLKSIRNTDRVKVESYKSKLKFEKSDGGKLEIKAAKKDYKLAKSQSKLPTEKIVRKTYVFDEKSGKVKPKLKIENEVKPINGRGGIVTKGIKGGTKAITNAAVIGIHRQISKYEEDNSDLKAMHKTEKVAEGAWRLGVRTVKTVNKNIKEAPYKKVSKLKFQSEKANRKLTINKTVTQNKEVVNLSKSGEAAKKAARKSAMKKNARKLQKTGGNSAKEALTKITKKIQEILTKNKYVFIGIIVVLLLIVIISSLFGSFAMMFSESSGSVFASTYMSDDTDMHSAESYMTSLENSLQNRIDNIRSEYTGYDEYRINADSVGHDPYALISYLSAKNIAFQNDTQLQSDITALYNALYYLEIKSITEVRSRQETRYDDYGNPYQITVYYNYYILEVNLTANDFNTVVSNLLGNPDQYELYQLLMETHGSRPDLFP